jgi:S1-C subfamily serine protease
VTPPPVPPTSPPSRPEASTGRFVPVSPRPGTQTTGAHDAQAPYAQAPYAQAPYAQGPYAQASGAEARGGPTASTGRRGLGGVLLAAVVAAVLASLVTAVVMRGPGGERVVERIVSAPLTLGDDPLDIGALLNKAQPSVVSIRTGGTALSSSGAGTGVIISDDGLVLTNAHVVGSATSAEVTLYDGSTRRAILVGSVPENDVALMAMVDPPPVQSAELGNSADVRVGDSVVAIGNALDLGGTPSVTRGIVSGKDREIEAPGNLTLTDLIQTDAAINPGNSGGPLVNALGQVVGINTAIISDAQNIGFAIAIDVVKPLIDEIRNGGGTLRADQAFLGVSMVSVEDLLDATRNLYGVEVDTGVFVTEVVAGSAAAEAGIVPGDVIVEVDGQEVRSPADVANIIRSRRAGDTITITIERNGKSEEVTVTLRTRADSGN